WVREGRNSVEAGGDIEIRQFERVVSIEAAGADVRNEGAKVRDRAAGAGATDAKGRSGHRGRRRDRGRVGAQEAAVCCAGIQVTNAHERGGGVARAGDVRVVAGFLKVSVFRVDRGEGDRGGAHGVGGADGVAAGRRVAVGGDVPGAGGRAGNGDGL